jgi:hypothetical protein
MVGEHAVRDLVVRRIEAVEAEGHVLRLASVTGVKVGLAPRVRRIVLVARMEDCRGGERES